MVRKLILGIIVVAIAISAPVRVARDVGGTASGRSNQRNIVRDSAGNLYVVYEALSGAEYQIFIARSSDGGASWNPTWANPSLGSPDNHNNPTIAIDSYDTLHIVWRGNYSSGNDANLLYTRYPNPAITTICAYSGYPSAYCPSIAVGPDNDLHVAWTGCPSSWFIRYMRYDRATSTWGVIEDVGPRTPSRWPAVEVDQAGRPHVVYRNTYSGHYHAAHRMKDAGVWIGYNGESHDSLDDIDIEASVEYTSIFIDSLENVHATWQWMSAFAANPDSVRYRKYASAASSWGAIQTPFGNSAVDAHITNPFHIVVDDLGYVYIFYDDSDSLYCYVYSDLGATTHLDTLLHNDIKARFPSARGSKWPAFNRPQYPCIDYVYTWTDPDSAIVSLMFDELCLEPVTVDTTKVCADYVLPLDSTFSSCSDQEIRFFVGCCEWGDSVKITSTDSTVEYFDSTTMTWEDALYLDPTPWGTYWVHLDTDSCNWIWSEYPASGGTGDWFRVFVNSGCSSIDTAFIRIQVDNQGTLYGNGTYIDTTHGNPGSGSTGWRQLFEFDLTAYFHGGVDTLEIMGYNAGGSAGMLFEIYVICSAVCCGEIDESTIDFEVDGSHYTIIDPELSWDGDSLLSFIPIPPDTFEHGDTVTACIDAVSDTCTGALEFPVCVSFFVDLEPPVIWGISPLPDTISVDLLPNFEFYLIDSMAGLDTGTVVFTVDGIVETTIFSPSGDDWYFQWTPDSSYVRGDSVELCLTAKDSAGYCLENTLDTCWYYYVLSCRPLDILIDCPIPCYAFSACSSAAIVFAVNDTAGFGIDTMRAYFTIIENHISGLADTSYLMPPSPRINFDFSMDSTITVWGNWAEGDSITITLDSLFSQDSCMTTP